MKLNNKEAIYGFCAWLTSREGVIAFGNKVDYAIVPGLIEQFARVNDLDEVTENWPNNLIHPSGKCSQTQFEQKTSEAIVLSEAMAVVKEAMSEKSLEPGSLAHGWHCNISMACYDAIENCPGNIRDHSMNIAEKAATSFMKHAFDVDTKS